MSSANNFKNPQSGMDLYGDERLKLGKLLRDQVLNELGLPWVIENGTLLGAWRSGKFILHDDDFDIAVFFEDNPTSIAQDILNKIKALLPPPYEARYVSSYADKIEVYDPTFGKYNLLAPRYNGASYHYVTADLQFYRRIDDFYHCMYYIQPNVINIPDEKLFPMGQIELEGEIFPAPADTEHYLKCQYGSLSPRAKFNMKTGLYEVAGEE